MKHKMQGNTISAKWQGHLPQLFPLLCHVIHRYCYRFKFRMYSVQTSGWSYYLQLSFLINDSVTTGKPLCVIPTKCINSVHNEEFVRPSVRPSVLQSPCFISETTEWILIKFGMKIVKHFTLTCIDINSLYLTGNSNPEVNEIHTHCEQSHK